MHDYESSDLASAAQLAELAGEADDMPEAEPYYHAFDATDAEIGSWAGEPEDLTGEDWCDSILLEVQPCPECGDSDPLCDYCHPF